MEPAGECEEVLRLLQSIHRRRIATSGTVPGRAPQHCWCMKSRCAPQERGRRRAVGPGRAHRRLRRGPHRAHALPAGPASIAWRQGRAIRLQRRLAAVGAENRAGAERALSDPRNTIIHAISSGLPRRLDGPIETSLLSRFAGGAERMGGLAAAVPGETALTRTPDSAASSATHRVSPSTACLLAE
jgi:hypothetical protein